MSKHTGIVRALALVALFALAALAAGCASQPGRDIPEPTGVSEETTATTVFYSTGRTLVQEPVVVDASDLYQSTLEKMLAADPAENRDIAIVQTVAPMNEVTFDEETGLVTVDWDPDVLLFEAEGAEERLAYAAIMMTLGQFPEVKLVRFTVDGKDEGTIGGKDIRTFWGSVSLHGQPWPALRPPAPSEEATASAS
jgi:hypothetical protein